MLLGALAIKATSISDEMKIAAAITMASAAEEGDLVPTPLDVGVHALVGAAVAKAAVKAGQAGSIVDDRLLAQDIFDELILDERQLPLASR